MAVALDGRMAYRDRAGIGRYVWELQRAMSIRQVRGGETVTLLLDPRDARTAQVGLRVRRAIAPARHPLERASLPLQLRPYRLAHFPDHGIPPGVRTPSVVTVHDLSFISHPQTYEPASRTFYARQIRTLGRAARVIAVSQFVRDQLLNRQLAPDDRVVVIPEAPSPSLGACADTARPLPAGRPYGLMLGTIQPRKNIQRGVRAFVQSRAAQDLDLLIAGAIGYEGPQIVRAVRAMESQGRVRFLGYVKTSRLAVLLRGAQLLLLPSLEEGFGLPALEAMALGVPCVLADAGALPEVAGDAALLVDPLSVDSISGAIERLADDEDLRHRLGAAGRVRAQDFSWDRAAAATLAVYRSVP